MFYMLDFIYLREDKNIENISFIWHPWTAQNNFHVHLPFYMYIENLDL
jgi:hypothetical protein